MASSRPTITRRHKQRGAALVEYVLLLALLAVVCIVAFDALGGEPTSQLEPSAPPATATTSSVPALQGDQTAATTVSTLATDASSQSSTADIPSANSPTLVLDCAKVYRSKAVAALSEAEDHGANESVYIHLERAQTYLKFAQEADKHQQQSCLLGSS